MNSRFIIVVFTILFPLIGISQNVETGAIKGLITEKETGDPLIGTNVYLKTDITVGTTTDIDGKYYLELETTIITKILLMEVFQIPYKKIK